MANGEQNLNPDFEPKEGEEVPGGPAIEPKRRGIASDVAGKTQNQIENKAAKYTGKAVGKAVAGALTSTGVGAAAAAIGDRVTAWVTERVAKLGLKHKWAFILPPLLSLLLLMGIAGVAFAGISKAWRGGYGNSQPEYIDPSSSQDMQSIAQVLENSTVLPGDPKNYYFNQGDERWGAKEGQAGGWSVNNYRSRACAITSASMAAKYFGVSRADPYDFGGYNATNTGSMLLSLPTLINYMKANSNGSYGYSGINKDIDSILTQIQKGNPVIASGNRAFGASGQHWVLIIGVSNDRKSLVINDPSAVHGRGRVARYTPASELNSSITKLFSIYEK